MKRSLFGGVAVAVLGSSLMVSSPAGAEPVFPNSDVVCDATQPFTLTRNWSPGAEYPGVPPVQSSIVVNSVADLPTVLAGLNGAFLGDNGGFPVNVVRTSAAYDSATDLNFGGQSSPYPGTIAAPTFDGADQGVPAALAIQDVIDGTPYVKAHYSLSDCTINDAAWPQWTGTIGKIVQENVTTGLIGAPDTTSPRPNYIEMIVRCPAGTVDVSYDWKVVMRNYAVEVRDPGQSGIVPLASIGTTLPSWPDMPLYMDMLSVPGPTLRMVVRPGDAGFVNANITCLDAGGAELANYDWVSTDGADTQVLVYHEPGNTNGVTPVPDDGALPLEVNEAFYLDVTCDRDAHGIDMSLSPGTTGLTAFSGLAIWTQGVYNRTPYGPIDREPAITPVWRNGYDSEVDGEIIDLQEQFTFRYGPFIPTSTGTFTLRYVCDDHVQGISVNEVVRTFTIRPEDVPVYDLALVKVVDDVDGIVAPGDDVSWTIRVTNQGTAPSGAFTVTDTLPTGVEFVSADHSGTESGGVVTWVSPAVLAPGESVDLAMVTTIPLDAADGASYRNWAEISVDGGADEDSTPDATTGSDQTPSDPYTDIDNIGDSILDNFDATDEDDNDDAEVTVDAPVGNYDLALVKVVNDTDGVAAPGDEVSWTIRVTNQGDVPSGVFDVTDSLPVGLEFVSASNGGTEDGGGSVIWTGLPSLAVGDSMDISVTTRIPLDATDGASYRNWAEISEDSGDDEDSTPDANFIEDDDYTDIDDLDDSVLDNFDATDEDDNDDAEITVDLDAPAVYDLALVKVVNDADGVVAVGDNVTWTIRVTNQGDVTSGVFNVTDVLPAGLIFVSAGNGGTESAGVVTWANLPAIASGSSVDLTVTTAVSAVAAGGTLRNWAEISSDSGDDEDSQPNTDVTDDEYTDIDDLDDSTLDNFDGTDEDDNDDAEIVVTAVVPPSEYDLALAKIVNDADGVVFAGSNVSWTIRVTNQGDVASGAYNVTDVLPAGLTFVSADNGGTAVNGVITWSNLPSIPAGATFDLHLVTKVGAVGSYRNWAEISTDSGDDVDSTPDPDVTNDPYVGTDDLADPENPGDEDDNDDATITVEAPVEETTTTTAPSPTTTTTAPVYDLALAKIVNGGSEVRVGTNVSWTVRVHNQGTVESGRFTVLDTVPAGLLAVSADHNGTISGQTVSWTVENLAPGQTVTLSVTTNVTAAGTYRNWAEISTDSGSDIDSAPDTDTANDSYVGTDDLDRPDQGEDDHDDAVITATEITSSPVTGAMTGNILTIAVLLMIGGALLTLTRSRATANPRI